MNTWDKNVRARRIAALAAGSVTSLALLSAILLLFAGVEPEGRPLELATRCGAAAAADCLATPADPNAAGASPPAQRRVR